MASGSRENNVVPEWMLAKQGINLFINNREKEAEELFLKNPESLRMYSGYSFVVFMDALMSFEEDKLAKAISTLKEVEKRCNSRGWFNLVKNKLFTPAEEIPTVTETLETQIILADSQVCLAILIFLQQDISGYLKAGWVLRKAWKVYQSTYTDILNLYNAHVGPLNLPDPTQIPPSSDSENVINIEKEILTKVEDEGTIDDEKLLPQGYGYSVKQIPHSKSEFSHLSCSNSSADDNRINQSCLSNDPKSSKYKSMRKSFSVNGALSKYNGWTSKFEYLSNSFSFNYLTSSLGFFNSKLNTTQPIVSKKVIIRLMNAVTFGYGLFQLGVSLLPPALLKLSNFLGLNGNRMHGLACLMYARLGIDMRAPLATLTLLWFHTIVRPYFALDGTNVSAGVQISKHLIKETEEQFGESAIFLFFRGRLCRLDSDISAALKAFQLAVHNATQREIKFLALHEVGWCYLLQLDFENAETNFAYLSSGSRWSRPFYCYMTCICKGSRGGLNNYSDLKEFVTNIRSSCKINQLDVFLLRRTSYFPEKDNFDEFPQKFWKIFVYEILYLWNALPSCSMENIEEIIEDCDITTSIEEPMKGISKLIQGSCYMILKKPDLAKVSLTQCIDRRSEMNQQKNQKDAHVLAFAQYELASILVETSETKSEARKLLQKIVEIKDYDFEERLAVRVNSLLRHDSD